MTELHRALERARKATRRIGVLVDAQDSPEALLEGSRALQHALEQLDTILRATNGFHHPAAHPEVRVAPRRVIPKTIPPISHIDRAPWDPEPVSSHIEVSRCRALLLEIVRRAAHDWILYRMHRRRHKKKLAQSAYSWLFLEDRHHRDFKERLAAGKSLTSFLVICETLDLDPETVRQHIRRLDIKTILSAGRPAENRKRAPNVDAFSGDTHSVNYSKISASAMSDLTDSPGIPD